MLLLEWMFLSRQVITEKQSRARLSRESGGVGSSGKVGVAVRVF
jgi:hypothetical protein